MHIALYRWICLSLTRRHLRSDCGQDLIEYAMLAGLISIVAIGAVSSVGGSIGSILWDPLSAATSW